MGDHAQLVEIARQWLRKTKRCSVVVSEIASMGIESPDALGWYGLATHLVECKTSRSDFLADKKKIFRNYLELGLGDYRWFLTLPGVIHNETELPLGFGWIEWDGKCRVIAKATYQPVKKVQYETSILLSLLKRIGQNPIKGASITCYKHQTKNRTVLELEEQTK